MINYVFILIFLTSRNYYRGEKVRPVGRIVKSWTGHEPIKFEDLAFRPAQMLQNKNKKIYFWS